MEEDRKVEVLCASCQNPVATAPGQPPTSVTKKKPKIMIPQPRGLSGMNTNDLLGPHKELIESIIGRDGMKQIRSYCLKPESRFNAVYFGLKNVTRGLEGAPPVHLTWEQLGSEARAALAMALQEDMKKERWGGVYDRYLETVGYVDNWIFDKLVYDILRNYAKGRIDRYVEPKTMEGVVLEATMAVESARNRVDEAAEEADKKIQEADEKVARASKKAEEWTKKVQGLQTRLEELKLVQEREREQKKREREGRESLHFRPW